MKIDDFFDRNSKSNFYLGMISQVYRDSAYVQVENLSLLNHRNIRLEILIPNTINYFVVIDSVQGLFMGEVCQSKVISSYPSYKSLTSADKENVFPQIGLNIIGCLGGDKFQLAGFKTVGITDKVYIANTKLVHKYLHSMEINDYIVSNSQKVKSFQHPLNNIAKVDNFDNEYLSLQPNTLFDRHLMVIGTTNSGKSTSSLSILDKLLLSHKKTLIIDPTGEYSHSFHDDEVDSITLGEDVFLSTNDLDDEFWINFFNVNGIESSYKAALLSDAIASLRYQYSKNIKSPLIKENQEVAVLLSKIDEVESKEFNIRLLVDQIKYEAVKQKKDKVGIYTFQSDGNLYNSGIWLMKEVSYALQSELIKKFFCFDGLKGNQSLLYKLDTFLKKENKKSLYINASSISMTDSTGKTIINLITKYIVEKKENDDAFVLFIDEVHRYTHKSDAESGLVQIAREGRKKGIFLFLTTQNPKDVPEVLLGQIGSLIIHRLTQFGELQAIQNQVDPDTLLQIKKLNQGEAILTSINLLQDMHIHFIASNRIHYNKTPIL
ncbi:ATP-binding protein [Convivina intestini]|uniref:ATP-binding protein n=1 Tax=Convivina intestini TaxID=1505726 RepID=UPI00200FDC38|nr:ATP-binding protein [Convivina intestini]CAH1851590.1 hypothetical protein R078131_00292 [Convivina intestini]